MLPAGPVFWAFGRYRFSDGVRALRGGSSAAGSFPEPRYCKAVSPSIFRIARPTQEATSTRTVLAETGPIIPLRRSGAVGLKELTSLLACSGRPIFLYPPRERM